MALADMMVSVNSWPHLSVMWCALLVHGTFICKHGQRGQKEWQRWTQLGMIAIVFVPHVPVISGSLLDLSIVRSGSLRERRDEFVVCAKTFHHRVVLGLVTFEEGSKARQHVRHNQYSSRSVCRIASIEAMCGRFLPGVIVGVQR